MVGGVCGGGHRLWDETRRSVHRTARQSTGYQHEWLVAVFLNDCGIEYTVRPDVGGLGYEADFYLPDPNLWVEVDGYVGGGRPNAANMEAKREYFESNGLDHVVVENSTELEEELRKRGALPEQRS